MVRELAPLLKNPHVREIRRFGAMVAVEFDDSKYSKAAIAGALDRDVLLITCGFHDQAVRFIPPLNISESDLRLGTSALVEAVDRAAVPATAR
jgi:4-aminobutyrate aminotransferase-like enzyme